MPFTPDCNLVGEHRRWLAGFHPQHLQNWGNLLDNDPEAAMSEAAVRRVLQVNGNSVEPCESLEGSRRLPDFRCSQEGKVFFVEVTSISIEKATKVTGVLHKAIDPVASGYESLNDAIFDACNKKTPQCSDLEHPALVAVCTHHSEASWICLDRLDLEELLTGDELITRKIDTHTGNPVGDTYISTKLRSAAFLRPQPGGGMRHARNPVSGILLCGLGCHPMEICGVLHPQPIHPFDRSLLPKVAFCRLQAGYESGLLFTEWI